MSMTTKHPLYSEFKTDWEQMRDTLAGERVVKEAGSKYLSPTSGMVADGYATGKGRGWDDYVAYRKRARFPDVTDEAVHALLGVMHSKPPTIELPNKMEYLRERASLRGESLMQLLQRVNEEQMGVGRLGLLADVIDRGERTGEFYVALYEAEAILNWDAGDRTSIEVENLSLVVLDETTWKRKPGEFTWEEVEQFRVLMLSGAAADATSAAVAEGEGTYQTGVFEDEGDLATSELITPSTAGRKSNEIPFVFVNAADVAVEPSKPPLLGLSNLSLTIYRGEADYRQSLFMQGQDTLVKIGAPDDPTGTGTRLGVGAEINIPTVAGDAKFIGVDSKGLPEQREALSNDYARAEQFAGKLMDSVTRERESGDALRIRVATRTATLNQIALAGAYGLERVLRKIARWMGIGEGEVAKITVTPNLDFVDDQMTGDQLRALMDAKGRGAPISFESVHRIMSQRNMTELSFEGEVARIKTEQELEKLLVPDDPEPPPRGDGPPSDPKKNANDDPR